MIRISNNNKPYAPSIGFGSKFVVYGGSWSEFKKDACWFGMNKCKNNRANRRKY